MHYHMIMLLKKLIAMTVLIGLVSGCSAAGSSDSAPLIEVSTASLTEAENAGTEACTAVFQSHGDVLEEAKDGSSGKAIIGDKSNDGLKALQSCNMSSAAIQEFTVFFRMTRVWSTAEDGKDEYSDITALTDLYVSCAHNGLASADQRQTCNDNLEAVNRIRDQIKEKTTK